jgi:hypothetical protein
MNTHPSPYLWAIYIKDHEVVPKPCKNFIWLLNSFWDHFGLYQAKFVRVTMKFEVPKRHIFEACIVHQHGQTCCVVERQRGALVETCMGPWHRHIVIIIFELIFFWEEETKTREDK